MFDPVGSTSWPNRHAAHLRRLDALLRAAGADMTTIVDIGPGGVSRAAAPFLNDAEARAGRLRLLAGDLARYADHLLRRIPFMPMRSLEPQEIERTITVPHRLVVVDRSRRILRAVQRDLPAAAVAYCDVAREPLPVDGDVVIAFNVVCRLESPAAGMAHIAAAVRPGGLLLMDQRSADAALGAHPEFSRIEPRVFRRGP